MEERRAIIKVDEASKIFKLPHEKNTSIKSVVVNFYHRKRGYELQKALDKITLDIYEGEFFGIVGRNGSGKSTLLKLLAGIYTPTTGAVHVGGSLTPFIELGVGFNAELTGRENVYLNGALLGFNRKEMQVMYKDIVEFAEIEKFMDQKLKNYSSGMQVRLAFSIAIRAQSDILLIDEVLAVGDVAFQKKCFDYFEELKKAHRTVVLVSHDMDSVKRFCSKAALITRGKLELVGHPNQVADLYDKQNAQDTKLSDTGPVINEGVEITELKVTGGKNGKFRLDDDITLHYTVRADRAVKIAVSLNIMKSEDGTYIAGTSSDFQIEPKIITPKSKAFYKLVIPSKQFSLGTFSVDGVIYDFDSKQPIFFKRSMAKFKTVGERNSWGAINLDSKWEEA